MSKLQKLHISLELVIVKAYTRKPITKKVIVATQPTGQALFIFYCNWINKWNFANSTRMKRPVVAHVLSISKHMFCQSFMKFYN